MDAPRPVDAKLDTPAPFHLEATVRVLQRRPSNPVDTWEEGRYRRVLPTSAGLALVEVEDRGTVDAPDVRVVVRNGAAEEVAPVLRRILGLDVDPAPLQRLAEAEPALLATARALRGLRPPRFPTLFETFASVVPFQQVSLDAGIATVGRLVARFGERVEQTGRLHSAFPTAGAVAAADVAELRACGLSAQRAASLVHVARAIEAGELDEASLAALPTRDAVRALTALPGIGPWSAGLVLLRGLGRLDVFPPGDVGVARGLAHLLGHEAVDAIVERFGDRRGYLYFYALAGALLEKGGIRGAA